MAWGEGIGRRDDFNIRIPEESIGNCKKYKTCGNSENVLRKKEEVLGNGYCMKCYDNRVDIRNSSSSAKMTQCVFCGDWISVKGISSHENMHNNPNSKRNRIKKETI